MGQMVKCNHREYISKSRYKVGAISPCSDEPFSPNAKTNSPISYSSSEIGFLGPGICSSVIFPKIVVKPPVGPSPVPIYPLVPILKPTA